MLLAVAVHSQNELLCDKRRESRLGFVCIPSWWRRAANTLGQWNPAARISVYTIDVAPEPCTWNSYKSSRILNALGELAI